MELPMDVEVSCSRRKADWYSPYKELIPCISDREFMTMLKTARDSVQLYKDLFH